MKTKKLLSMVLVIAMLLSITNIVYAEADPVPVTYLDDKGVRQTCSDYLIMTSSDDDVTAIANEWYVIDGDVTLSGKLRVIDSFIILKDNSTLTVEGGIEVVFGGCLAIYAQSTGDDMGKLEIGYTEYSSTPTSSSLSLITYRRGIDSEGEVAINGGDIKVSVDAEGITMDNPSNSGVEMSGIYSRLLTVNGGKVDIDVGDIPNTYNQGRIFGICTNNVTTLNGGSLKAVAGNVACGGYAVSYGLASYLLEVNGGTLDVTGESEFDIYYAKLNVTGGSIKNLVVDYWTEVELAGGTYEKITLLDGASFENLVKSGYGYVDEDDQHIDITGISELTNVKVVKGNFPYSQKNAAAEVVTTTGSNDIETNAELLDALVSPETVSIKLNKSFNLNFDDLEELENEYGFYKIEVTSPKLTLDLNGNRLNIFAEAMLVPGYDFTLTDTSRRQNGRFVVMAIEGSISDVFDDSSVGEILMPKFTVAGGELSVMNEFILECYDMTISGGTVRTGTYTYYDDMGFLIVANGSFNVSDGTIEAKTLLAESKVNITGGKFPGESVKLEDQFIPVSVYDGYEPRVPRSLIDDFQYGVVCMGCDGIVSDGEFAFFAFNNYIDENLFVKIKGGKFESIVSVDSDQLALSTLSSGYAFYNIDDDKVADANTGILYDVYVKEHTCNFKEETTCKCGRSSVVAEPDTVPEDAIAKLVLRNEFGNSMVIYVETMNEPIPSGFFVESITFLKDWHNTTSTARYFEVSNRDMTIDLNGHKIDFGYTDADEYVYNPIELQNVATVTIKDSSKKQNGELNVMGISMVRASRLIIESGTVNCISENGFVTGVIAGTLEVRGGTLDYGDSLVMVVGGKVIVSGGTVKSYAISMLNVLAYDILSVDDTEPTQLTEIAKETGDTMLVTGGKVISNIGITEGTSLRVTGGEVGVLAETEEDENLGILVESGGAVYISGGKIASLSDVQSDEDTDKKSIIELSGGTYGCIEYAYTELEDMLADNHAYYTKGSRGNNYNTLVRPLTLAESEQENVRYFEDIQVKEHICSFNSEGVCDCGKEGKANAKAVMYLDIGGNPAYQNYYELITNSTEELTGGWYVVDGNVNLNEVLYISGDVHLILKDGCTLNANQAICGMSESSELTVYAQSTGSNVGKLVAKGNEEYYGIDYLGKLTVNGGIINAIGKSIDDDYDDYNYWNSGAVYVEVLTMNGGTLNATGGNINIEYSDEITGSKGLYSIGISCDYLIVNGGIINATGGTIKATGSSLDIGSYGIAITYDAEISGGTVNAIAGDVTSTETGTNQNSYSTWSCGLYSGDVLRITGGRVVAKGSNASRTIPTGTNFEYDETCSYGIYGCYAYIDISGGEVDAISGNASAKNGYAWSGAINGRYDMGIYGGTVTTTIGKAMYAYDCIVSETFDICGGTLQSTRPGGAVGIVAYYKLDVSGGSFKMDNGYIDRFETEDEYISEYLANGYSYYKYDRDIGAYSYLENPATYSADEVEIYPGIISVYVKIGDENGSSFDISSYAHPSAESVEYTVVDVYDSTKITVTCDEDGILNIKANESADEEFDDIFAVCISADGDMDRYIYIAPTMINKIIPQVTLSKTYLEKTYDGKFFSERELEGIATVTDGTNEIPYSVAFSAKPTENVSNTQLSLIFVPNDTETYSRVTVPFTFIINPAKIEGEPTYQKIDEKGKTLADAQLTANKNWPKGKIKWVDQNGSELESITDVTQGTTYNWVFCPEDALNYTKLEGEITLWKDSGHGGGSGGSRPTTPTKPSTGDGTVTNEDGSTTTISTDDKTGTVTETMTKTDGSTTVTETKTDGTTIKTETDKNGETKSEISVGKKGESTEVTIPTDKGDDVTSVIVTDKDGNKTEITDFEKGSGGISFTVSGDCTVELVKNKTTAKKQFKDVHKVAHWAEIYIDYVVANGLMNGTSVDEFSPDEKLTRGMLVTVLYRLAGEPDVEISDEFEDVSIDEYYAKAVAWAKQNGIVNGISVNVFAPDKHITREQIVTIIYRFAKYMGYDISVGENTNILSYTDFEDISEYAIEAMQYAVGAGIIQGKSEGSLNPQEFAERAEVAAIIQRFIEANK